MPTILEKSTLAKPFLKWAGGKGQLIEEIEARLPEGLRTGEIDTYIEPFVGGGAVFFYIAQKYKSINSFYLCDINHDLINCYNAIKFNVDALIDELQTLEHQFLTKDGLARKSFYYRIREQFNQDRTPSKLIFLNKTCFNGLYRVNKKGAFNVPLGDYKKPTICNEENLRIVSQVLQQADVFSVDFVESAEYIGNNAFVYLDPPYRPLNKTAYFTSYCKDSFAENDQIRLAEFCRRIHRAGAKFLLSNSDPKNEDPTDHFFEDHYKGFAIDKVKAARIINCKASGRGQINELTVTNYQAGDQKFSTVMPVEAELINAGYSNL